MKRAVIAIGAVGVTGLLVWLALTLGAVGFDTRRFPQHERRLQKLVRQEARMGPVVQGLADEKSPLVGSADDAPALRRVAEVFGGVRKAEVLEKGGRFPHTRVFDAADMRYFIYFDADEVMRDFTLVSR